MKHMKAFEISVAAMMAMASAAFGVLPDTLSGTVFLDANGNGVREAGEAGLSGVAVTDGVSFVTTGEDGRYSITIGDDEMFPFREAQCVYPAWPSGLWPSRARWWVRLSDVTDAKNVNFGMKRVPADEPFTFATFGDEHSGAGASYPHLAAEVNALKRVRFVVVLGDYGYAGRETGDKAFGDIAQAAKAFEAPVFHVPGNHDIVSVPKDGKPEPVDLWAFQTKHLGPPRFSFDYGGAHFVAIDSDRYEPETNVTTHGHPPTAAAWLRRDLERVKPETPTFLLTHLLYGNDGVTEMLRKQTSRFAYMGHTHIASCVDFDGTMGAVSFALSVTSVKDGRFAVGERVLVGQKVHAGYSLSGIHYWDTCVAPGLESYWGKTVSWDGRGRAQPLEAGAADWAHVVARFTVPKNGSVGLRIGKDKTVDIVCENGAVIVDGLAFDAPVVREGAAQTWQILIDRPYMGYMTLVTGEPTAEGGGTRARVMLPVQVDMPSRVTPLGQTEAFSRLDLHALKPIAWRGALPLYHWSPHGWKWGAEHYRDLFSGLDNDRSQEMRRRHGIK